MVKHVCEICNTPYSNISDAEKCEKKGLIGPIFNPGILFSHKNSKNGFLILYKEMPSEGHERRYYMEEISSTNISTYPVQEFNLLYSDFKRWMGAFKISTDEELNKFNKLIQEKNREAGNIRASMGRFHIKELHNKCNLDNFL
jgi:hypothetical protein